MEDLRTGTTEGVATGPSDRPTNFVAGVIGAADEFEHAVNEIIAAGVKRESIGVLQGQRGADAIAGRHAGGLRSWFQRTGEALSDETRYVDRYEEEARRGGYVIGVPLPDARDTTRERIRQILRTHGGRFIVSSTRYTHSIEE